MQRLLSALVLSLAAVLAAEPTAENDAAQKERLAKLQPLVGSWRGVGQPQRSSTKDSWIEEADWAWHFAADGPSLVATLPKAKYFKQLKIVPGKEDRHFELWANPLSGGGPVAYHGQLDEQGQLLLSADEAREDLPRRLSFRFAAGGDRLLLLMEKKSPAGEQLTRLAEVGYTRQGSGFGKGSTGPECIVTGGLATIDVSYNGKKYAVCCTGCRDYFNENPEKVLAEYQARKDAK